MRRLLIMLAILSIVFGCATTGIIANLEKGDKKEEVRMTLGEPTNMVSGTEGEIWEYLFVKEDGVKGERYKITMGLTVTFKGDEVDDYKLTVSKAAVKELEEKVTPPRRPSRKRPFRPRPHSR